MTRLYTKKEGIQKYTGKLCPSIQDRLEKLKVESQYERHVVDLEIGRAHV